MEQTSNIHKVRDIAKGFFGWIIFHNLVWFITFWGFVFLDALSDKNIANDKVISTFEILMWLTVIAASFVLFGKKKNWISVGVIAAFLINVLILSLRNANGNFYGLPALLEGLINLT